jgi:hypothetical protein
VEAVDPVAGDVPFAWSPIHRYRGWPFQVTCPPEIVASVPVTPGPAVGVPVAVNGGHADAHAPVQALVVAPIASLSNVYSVSPLASVSTEPSFVDPVRTVADPPFAVVGVAPAATDFDPLLEQPATTIATAATATQPSPARRGAPASTLCLAWSLPLSGGSSPVPYPAIRMRAFNGSKCGR